MINAFFWGFIATISLTIGGIIGILFKIGKKPLGLIMSFGAGVLIAAVAYELTFEAVKRSVGSGASIYGIFAGAFTFYFCDRLINKFGAQGRKDISGSHSSNITVPIVLATILDGIPETLVIGMGLIGGGKVSIGMLVAVFVSNLPEAIAGTTGMVSGGWKPRKIILLWLLIAVVCAFASVAGFSLLANVTPFTLSFIQTFAAGAILVMVTNTMIPEAYEHGGKLAGIFTVIGFAVAISIIVLENTIKH